jgi:hypothetical protein
MKRALETAKHLLAPLTANCRDFHERWRNAPAPGEPQDPSGRWEGEWISSATGHRGPLRAVVLITSPARLQASFHAGYSRVFRACYAADLHTSMDPQGLLRLSGRSDLGRLAGGVYEYDGEISASLFVCRYRSRMDEGEFRLARSR